MYSNVESERHRLGSVVNEHLVQRLEAWILSKQRLGNVHLGRPRTAPGLTVPVLGEEFHLFLCYRFIDV